MKIFVVRHGETDSNKAKKLMGQRIDELLNSNGIKQAEELADKLIDNNFDVIFSSPLKRALQTAEIIAGKINVSVYARDGLLERDFGSMSGKSWDEMIEKVESDNFNLKKIDFEQKYDYRPYGGECSLDVKKRLFNFFDELKSKYYDKKVLIITHGGILKLAHLILKERTVDISPENASIHEFDI